YGSFETSASSPSSPAGHPAKAVERRRRTFILGQTEVITRRRRAAFMHAKSVDAKLLALSFLMLAACGGDDGGSVVTQAPAGAPPPPSAPPPPVIPPDAPP